MTTKAGSKSEVDVLLRAARSNGYKTVPAQGGHKKIVDRHGKPVVDSNGPLIVSSSPSDARWRVMTVKRWLAAGVLKEDPFEDSPKGKGAKAQLKGGAVSGKGGRSRLADEDVQAAKVAAIKARSAEQRRQALEIREKVEPIMVKIGGWDKYGVQSQFADAVFWFNGWRNHVEHFPTASAARSAVANLRKGNALNENSQKAISYFVDEILKAPDPRERYFELVRLSKGLPAKEEEPIRGGTPLPDPPPKEAATNGTNGHGSEKRIGPATKPSLALEAVAQMMVGRTEIDERILKIGEEIQEMELHERGLV